MSHLKDAYSIASSGIRARKTESIEWFSWLTITHLRVVSIDSSGCQLCPGRKKKVNTFGHVHLVSSSFLGNIKWLTLLGPLGRNSPSYLHISETVNHLILSVPMLFPSEAPACSPAFQSSSSPFPPVNHCQTFASTLLPGLRCSPVYSNSQRLPIVFNVKS